MACRSPPAVGALTTSHLLNAPCRKRRQPPTKAETFEHLGFRYPGPIDGHDSTCWSRPRAPARGAAPVRSCFTSSRKRARVTPPPRPRPTNITGWSISTSPPATGQAAGRVADLYKSFRRQPDQGGGRARPAHCRHHRRHAGGTGLDDFTETFHSSFFDVGIAEQQP